MGSFRQLTNTEILQLFLGKKKGNLWRLVGIIIPNLLATLLEGISYGCILLAFASLSGSENTLSLPLLSNWMASLNDRQIFVVCTISAICLQMLRSCFTYIAQIFATFLGMRIQIDIQRRVYQQILKFTFPYVSRYKVGDLMDHAQTPAQVVCPIVDVCHSVIVSLFAIAISLGLMLFISPLLTLLACFLFGTFVFMQKFVLQKVARISRNLSTHLVSYSKHLAQSLGAMRVIHTFHRQQSTFEKVTDILDDIGRVTRKMNLFNHSFTPLNEIFGIASVGLFLVVGARLAAGEGAQLALPILLTFITIVHRLGGRVQAVVTGASALAGNWGKLTRLEEILSKADKEFYSSCGEPCQGLSGNISLQNVSLSYARQHTLALKEVNLVIPKNSMVAFVGSSGAGKSSIMDLLVRLYEPTSGEILIDDTLLSQLSLESWREQLAVVCQDTFIFNETIEENIRFGRLDASANDVVEAAKMANAHEFISRLPSGYQTIVGERGFRLSGGERQRIALARALVRNAEILILDEATSNLDSHSEKLIQQALNKLNHKKTILIVAHRLSTIIGCDTIFVFEEGRVVEQGKHEELLAANGRYSFLWETQSGSLARPDLLSLK